MVTRQEEAVDAEDEADFEREYARMMAESLESRKFERKPLFDVPLPVRPKNRESPAGGAQGEETPAMGNTMAFALLTKKGNRQQVGDAARLVWTRPTDTGEQTRTVELPSDSTFAIAMKTQQQAEKEEQQRIKNLVLNYDLQQSEDQEGELLASDAWVWAAANATHGNDAAHDRPTTFYHNRIEKPGKDRNQRVRKLQLSDVDW